jgi:hypothetical protein
MHEILVRKTEGTGTRLATLVATRAGWRNGYEAHKSNIVDTEYQYLYGSELHAAVNWVVVQNFSGIRQMDPRSERGTRSAAQGNTEHAGPNLQEIGISKPWQALRVAMLRELVKTFTSL